MCIKKKQKETHIFRIHVQLNTFSTQLCALVCMCSYHVAQTITLSSFTLSNSLQPHLIQPHFMHCKPHLIQSHFIDYWFHMVCGFTSLFFWIEKFLPCTGFCMILLLCFVQRSCARWFTNMMQRKQGTYFRNNTCATHYLSRTAVRVGTDVFISCCT